MPYRRVCRFEPRISHVEIEKPPKNPGDDHSYAGVRLISPEHAGQTYMFSIITWPNPEHETWVAPSISRAKS
jgi:hypothetical protein